MKVILEACPGTGMEVMTEDGKTVRVRKITITPYFRTSQGAAEMLVGTAQSKRGMIVDRFLMMAAGKTGKVTRREHNPKGVEPHIDRDKVTPAEEPAEEPPEAIGENEDDTDE